MRSEWSIVTVTHNSANDLARFSVTYNTDDPAWIVVDNKSTDATISVAASLGSRNVIELGRNQGFSKANNIGLELVETKYVAFVNPDVTVELKSFDDLNLDLLENGSIVAPQLQFLSGENQPNGRNFPFLFYKVSNRLGFLTKWRSAYQIFASSNQVQEVPWVIGAVVMGKTETFRNLGGWPERYFLYYEDTALSLEVRKSGGAVHLLGDHKWVHGWKRETSKFRLKPWMRELSSMIKFYCDFPIFLGLPSRKSLLKASQIYNMGRKNVG